MYPASLDSPSVGESSATNITSRSGRTPASINPNHFATRYRFQYLTESAYLTNGESFAGAAETQIAEPRLGRKTGTARATVNRYECGNEPTPFESWRKTQMARRSSVPWSTAKRANFIPSHIQSGLPDGRGYELVSPAEKAEEVFPPDASTELNGSCKQNGEPSNECYPGLQSLLMPMQVSLMGMPSPMSVAPFTRACLRKQTSISPVEAHQVGPPKGSADHCS